MDAPGPEYESAGALGPLCQVSDVKAVCYANHLCSFYGLDIIPTGASIAFAMECLEKGLLSNRDLDGIELTWGNAEALTSMVHKIEKADGAGKRLGLGTRRMTHRIGHGSEGFAVRVKGLELPMHDARAGFAWASNYATATRGGCHLHGMTDFYETSTDPIPEWGFSGKYTRLSNEGKAEMTRFAQNWAHVLDWLVMCYLATAILKPSDFCSLINALQRAYNWRCGVRRKDDIQSDGRPSRQMLKELVLQDAERGLYSA